MSPDTLVASKQLSLWLGGTSLAILVRYLIWAGLAWLLGYVWFRRRWFHRKVVQAFPERSEIWREMRYSLMSILIFGAVAVLTVVAIREGWTRMYRGIDSMGWPWFWASIVITILLHDTYFYWTHRWMHHPRLFRLFHRVHHLSKNPTPWAAYAFSPLEAVVQAGIFPLTVFLIPIHPLAFGLFMLWQISFNVIGHTGYEIYRPGFMDSWPRWIMNTPTCHAMHHEKIHGNFGLYFSFWDRLMKTHHPDYETRFREVAGRSQRVKGEEAANVYPDHSHLS